MLRGSWRGLEKGSVRGLTATAAAIAAGASMASIGILPVGPSSRSLHSCTLELNLSNSRPRS